MLQVETWNGFDAERCFWPRRGACRLTPRADTSESLGRRALCSSVRAARAAKTRPGAGRQTGQQRTAASKSSFRPDTVTDQEGNRLGNGHLKNFHYSLIRVLPAIPRRAKQCLRKGRKKKKKGSGKQTDSSKAPPCPAAGGGPSSGGAAQGRERLRAQAAALRGEQRTDRPNGAAPSRPAPPRAALRTSGPSALRPAPPPGSVPLRAESSRVEPHAAGRSRGGAEPAGPPQRRDFLRGSPRRAPPGSSYALRGSRGAGAAPCSRCGAVIQEGRAQWKP